MSMQLDFQTATQKFSAGLHDEAEALLLPIVDQLPKASPALHLLGLIRHCRNRSEEGARLIQRAIEADPSQATYHNSLGEVLRALGDFQGAQTCYKNAIALNPVMPDAHHNMGILKLQLRDPTALQSIQQAIKLRPRFGMSWVFLSTIHHHLSAIDAALDAAMTAVEVAPKLPQAHTAMGIALRTKGMAVHAERALRNAIALDGEYPEAWNTLGRILLDMADIEGFIEACRRSIQLAPHLPDLQGVLLMGLHYSDQVSFEEIQREHDLWAQRHTIPASTYQFENDRNPDRRLRVGYLSPDLRSHAAAGFIEPLLSMRDRTRYEAIVYHDCPTKDHVTERFRGLADAFHEVSTLSDRALLDRIRLDRIDVLYDLAGHSAGNRLRMLAHRAAPVQLSYGAYHTASGLGDRLIRVGDAVMDPPNLDTGEQMVRIPGCSFVWTPLESTPDIGPLPADTNGHITFGCLNRVYKFTPTCMKLWAQVMERVEGSELILIVGGGEPFQKRLGGLLTRHGLNVERVQMLDPLKRFEYMKLHGATDIGLDTFPYAGCTTTMEAIWMGVPVVTMTGHTGVSRAGASICTAVGLNDLVVDNPDDYVQAVASLAADRTRLRSLRVGLREQLRQSVGDRSETVSHFEAMVREQWRKWVYSFELS